MQRHSQHSGTMSGAKNLSVLRQTCRATIKDDITQGCHYNSCVESDECANCPYMPHNEYQWRVWLAVSTNGRLMHTPLIRWSEQYGTNMLHAHHTCGQCHNKGNETTHMWRVTPRHTTTKQIGGVQVNVG